MTTHLIFIHGASSAGKSTLARAVQNAIQLPFWHISIDHLRDSGVLPTQRFKAGDFDWKSAKPAVFDGFHRSLAAYLAAGNNLILEHILERPEWHADLQNLFRGYDVFFVGLHTPLEALEAREQARGDRPIGSAASDFGTVHSGLAYDLELSGQDDLASNVDDVLKAWSSRSTPSSFFRS